jgi:D-alanyl-D-alanine carboxypeptidase
LIQTGAVRRTVAHGLVLLVVLSSTISAGMTATKFPSAMIWHAETLDGRVISSRKPDRMFNPASVIKVATSGRALEILGPEFRFDTVFKYVGPEKEWPPTDGELSGDLVVVGGADPDFQLENAFKTAVRLNQIGIDALQGRLLVDARFWIGWEKGSSGRLENRSQRARLMASRLRSALDSHRWDRKTQRAWKKYAFKNGLDAGKAPRIHVQGGYGFLEKKTTGRVVLTHRSKPLVDLLRRFNAYSNNDIERLDTLIGTPEELADWLNQEEPGELTTLETSSGLGVNRMSPKRVVRMVRDLLFRCQELGVDPRLILPSSGCKPGTLASMFPRLRNGEFQGAVVGKTGTLIYTDGGVSVLAGMADTRDGKVLFCVAYPNGGRKRHWARRLQETWLLELIQGLGGPIGHECPEHFPSPEDGSSLITTENSLQLDGGP